MLGILALDDALLKLLVDSLGLSLGSGDWRRRAVEDRGGHGNRRVVGKHISLAGVVDDAIGVVFGAEVDGHIVSAVVVETLVMVLVIVKLGPVNLEPGRLYIAVLVDPCTEHFILVGDAGDLLVGVEPVDYC